MFCRQNRGACKNKPLTNTSLDVKCKALEDLENGMPYQNVAAEKYGVYGNIVWTCT